MIWNLRLKFVCLVSRLDVFFFFVYFLFNCSYKPGRTFVKLSHSECQNLPPVASFSPVILQSVVSAALCQPCLASRTATSAALLCLYSEWLAAPGETGVFTSSGNSGTSPTRLIFKEASVIDGLPKHLKHLHRESQLWRFPCSFVSNGYCVCS